MILSVSPSPCGQVSERESKTERVSCAYLCRRPRTLSLHTIHTPIHFTQSSLAIFLPNECVCIAHSIEGLFNQHTTAAAGAATAAAGATSISITQSTQHWNHISPSPNATLPCMLNGKNKRTTHMCALSHV